MTTDHSPNRPPLLVERDRFLRYLILLFLAVLALYTLKFQVEDQKAGKAFVFIGFIDDHTHEVAGGDSGNAADEKRVLTYEDVITGIYRLFRQHGIQTVIEGSHVYGIQVRRSQATEAVHLLRSSEYAANIRFSDDPSSKHMTTSLDHSPTAMTKYRLLICGIVVLAGVIVYSRISATRTHSALLSLKSVSQIQARLGNPVYTFTTCPPGFGLALVTPNDFTNGILIEVYFLRKMPPHFLAVKKRQDSDEVIASNIERS